MMPFLGIGKRELQSGRVAQEQFVPAISSVAPKNEKPADCTMAIKRETVKRCRMLAPQDSFF